MPRASPYQGIMCMESKASPSTSSENQWVSAHVGTDTLIYNIKGINNIKKYNYAKHKEIFYDARTATHSSHGRLGAKH